MTPGLRRRRERAERHKSFIREQQEASKGGLIFGAEDSPPALDDRNNNNNNSNKLNINNETNNIYSAGIVIKNNGEVTLDLTPTKPVPGKMLYSDYEKKRPVRWLVSSMCLLSFYARMSAVAKS